MQLQSLRRAFPNPGYGSITLLRPDRVECLRITTPPSIPGSSLVSGDHSVPFAGMLIFRVKNESAFDGLGFSEKLLEQTRLEARVSTGSVGTANIL